MYGNETAFPPSVVDQPKNLYPERVGFLGLATVPPSSANKTSATAEPPFESKLAV